MKKTILIGAVAAGILFSGCTKNSPQPKNEAEYSADFFECLKIVEKRLQSPENRCMDAGSSVDRIYLAWDCMVKDLGWDEKEVEKQKEKIERIQG